MARTTIDQLKKKRLAAGTAAERAAFEETYAAASLALRVGEQTSQAAIARLEAGAVGATLTTLQRAAVALDLLITVELRPAS